MIFFLTLFLAIIEPKPEDAVLRLSVDELRTSLAKDDAVIVDVRGDVPYSLEHIRGAISMPLGLIASRAAELPHDKLIVTYCTCSHGEQSIAAVLELEKSGITRAAALHGGLRAWSAAGLPVVKAPPENGDAAGGEQSAASAAPALATPTSTPTTATPTASGGRLRVPAFVSCNRNHVTSYVGQVTALSRTDGITTLRIATDAGTTETVRSASPRYRVDGNRMKYTDSKRTGVGQRATVWVCRDRGFAPVIDWHPDRPPTNGD